MKKIPTLFERVFEGHKIVGITDKINPALEGVDISKLRPTIKVDGSCCAIINDRLFKRYDAKGKNIPANAIPCQDEPDPVTGHFPCWVPCKVSDPSDRWFWVALQNAAAAEIIKLVNGTYEAIGPHFQGNPYGLLNDTLYLHGSRDADVDMTFPAIKKWLEDHYEEGLVFWDENGPVCKIKRSDFGLKWNKGGKRKMKITFKQDKYNDVELTLSLEELDTILDNIEEDQIENVSVTIKKPEADNGKED